MGTLMMLCLSSLVILSALELERSFKKLKNRTTLLLCTKEAKGELDELLTLMGRTNWAIKNVERVKLISMLFPGTQIASKSAEDIKRGIQWIQNIRMVSHLRKIASFKKKGCPLDPYLIQTPFEIRGATLKREQDGSIKLRRSKWTHHFILRPYVIHLNVKLKNWEASSPLLEIYAEDNREKFSSHLRAF